MKRPLTVVFMLYHEGNIRLPIDVIARSVDWINANSELDIIPIIKRATWDGQVSKIGALYHLDPGDVDQSEIPDVNPETKAKIKYVVLFWSCKKLNIPYEAACCPSALGYVYGPDDETFRRTGTRRGFLSIPYNTSTDPMLPEGTDTTDPDREGAIARAIKTSGWPTGIMSTFIHEFQNLLVATLRVEHGIWMKSTYRPQPGDPLQEWFDNQDPKYAYEPTVYKAVFDGMTPEMIEKVADFVPPVVPAPIPSGLRDKLIWMQDKLQDIEDELEDLQIELVKIINEVEP